MPQNWWEAFPEVSPSTAARLYPLPGPSGIMPGPALGLRSDPLYGAPRLGPVSGGGFDPSSLAGAPMLGQFPGSSPDQAPPIGYPQLPIAGGQAGPLSNRRLAVQQAAAAIRNGADPRAVRARLNQVGADDPGFDPSDLFSDLLPGIGQAPGLMSPPQGPQPDAFSGDLPPFARDSVPGDYGASGLAGGMAAQMTASSDPGNLQPPRGLVGSDGATYDRTSSFPGLQSGLDPRSYAAAYPQNPSDTLPANQLGLSFNGNGYIPASSVSDAQMRQPGDGFLNHMRAVVDSLPPDPATRAQPLPPEHALSGPPARLGSDGAIVVTGPPQADRPTPHHAGQSSTTLQDLGRALTSREGNYESYNSGTLHYRVIHSFTNRPPGTVTGRTINEILRSQSLPPTDPRRMFAVGRYQIIGPTLRLAVRAMHLTGNERFTPELQDRIFAEYLLPHTPGLANFIFHGRGSVEDAQYAAARRWASIAVPQGRLTYHRRRSNGHMTFFDNTGHANRASESATNALITYLSNLRR